MGVSSPYWLQAYYEGTNYTQSYDIGVAYTSILVPSAGTVDGDQIALVLSEFDNNGYYDQIGLASDYGCPSGCGNPSNTWTVAWEQGTYGTYGSETGCGWAGSSSRDAYTLTPNQWYTFMIHLTGTYPYKVQFAVFSGIGDINSTSLWSTSLADSATTLEVTSYYNNCNGHTGYDNTDSNTLYEEVEYIASNSQNFPHYDFLFNETTVGYWNGAGWTSIGMTDSLYTSGQAGNNPISPHGYYLDFSRAPRVVVLANQAYMFMDPTDIFHEAPGGEVQTTARALTIGLQRTYGYSPGWTDYCLNNTCTVPNPGPCNWPSGWSSGTCGWSSAIPFSVTYSVYVPSNAASGEYYGSLSTTISIGTYSEYSVFILYIEVS